MIVSAPADTSMTPTGPPTPVAISTPPATTIAPPATYSQLFSNQWPAALVTLWNAPPMPLPSRYCCSSASVTGRSPLGSEACSGSFPAYAYGLPDQPAPVTGSRGSTERKPCETGS